MTKLGRKPATIGLVFLALLLASGSGAAQSVTGTVEQDGSASVDETIATEHASDADGSIDAGLPAIEQNPHQQVCPPGQYCTPGFESGDDEGHEASADLSVESDAELYVDVDALLELVPKAPEGDDENETPADDEHTDDHTVDPAPEEETPSASERFEANYNGSGSIDHNASASAHAYVDERLETNPPPAPPEDKPTDEEETPAPPEEKPAPERTPLDLTAQASAFLAGCREVDHELSSVVELPSQERPAPSDDEDDEVAPIDHTLETEDGVALGFSFDHAFEASTKGLTGAASHLGSAVQDIVNAVRGAFSTEAAAEASSSAEAVTSLAGASNGSIGAAANATAGIENLVADVQAPEIAPPTVDLQTESKAESSTKVSTGVLGDVDLGL